MIVCKLSQKIASIGIIIGMMQSTAGTKNPIFLNQISKFLETLHTYFRFCEGAKECLEDRNTYTPHWPTKADKAALKDPPLSPIAVPASLSTRFGNVNDPSLPNTLASSTSNQPPGSSSIPNQSAGNGANKPKANQNRDNERIKTVAHEKPTVARLTPSPKGAKPSFHRIYLPAITAITGYT
jgi:hypothetical protein